uniref:Uncharacterized protein n=1 Tax=Aegilops tauschii TaxID=37682 RepID=M8C1J7_AEGTA
MAQSSASQRPWTAILPALLERIVLEILEQPLERRRAEKLGPIGSLRRSGVLEGVQCSCGAGSSIWRRTVELRVGD